MDKTRRLLGFPRILALLEYCAPSSLGKSLIATIRASDDPAEITRWLDEVTGVRELLESETAPPLDGLVDLREPLQALKRPGTIADPSFCLVLAEFLRAARRLKSYLLKRQESHLLIAEPFIDLEVPVHLAERVKKVLDSNGEIKDNASHDLKRLRRTLLRSRDELRVKMDEEARRLSADGTLQENVVTIRNGRYVLPVKVEKQGQFDGLVHDRSASGATMFMEPMSVVKANNNLIGLALEERAEMSRLMLEISDHIRAETDSLGWVIEVLGRFEVIVAKASLSQMMEAVAVKVVPEGEVDLLQARHPLLGSKAVPQDIRMDARCHTLIITGQNAGGKTVTLKTLGLLAIMLTFGLHLPCHADSRLSVFREIHADIGDEQSLERDLSTFSAHLEHLKIILARPGGPDCLVLLDELGDGTDPREGAALAVSVARSLHFKRTRMVITSHYTELKALAASMPGMENASMGVDEQSLCPTFELHVGLPGKSYALRLARRVGIPDQVIVEAERVLPESGRLFEKVIVDLEQALKEVDEHRRQLEEREENLEEREKDVARREKGAAGDRLADFIQFTRMKTREIQDLVGSLKRASAGAVRDKPDRERKELSRRLGAQVLKTVSRSRREAKKKAVHAGVAAAAWEPQTGQWAEISSRGIKGEIVHVGQERLKLLVGRVEMWVNLSEAKQCRPSPISFGRQAVSGSLRKEKTDRVAAEINVVGFRVEAALEKVDKFIDDAVVAGLDTIRVIHGRGTYALRNALWEFLDGHTHVSSCRKEDSRLGGDGVTVVDLV